MSTREKRPEEPTAGSLLVVDGHCYAYRAFFGMAPLTSPAGEPTHAIYGFIRMLSKIRSKLRPAFLLVVWDGGLAEERTRLLPEYKMNRPEMPPGLRSQLDPMQEYLKAAGVPTWREEGCEADDCIAFTATRAAAAGLDVVIASSDKDFMQLVCDRIKLLAPQDKTESLWDAAQVAAKTGVQPGQIVDWLSLTGDAADNIPGARGVGPKTAADLMRQFGSVDVLYRSLNMLKSERLRTALKEAQEQVRRNQQLIRLTQTMNADFSLEKLAVKEENQEQLRRLYAKWGFRHLLASLDAAPKEAVELFHEHSYAN